MSVVIKAKKTHTDSFGVKFAEFFLVTDTVTRLTLDLTEIDPISVKGVVMICVYNF